MQGGYLIVDEEFHYDNTRQLRWGVIKKLYEGDEPHYSGLDDAPSLLDHASLAVIARYL